MKAVIVDTSALIRLYVPDGPSLMVPELALAEVTQVLRSWIPLSFYSPLILIRKPDTSLHIFESLSGFPLSVFLCRTFLYDST